MNYCAAKRGRPTAEFIAKLGTARRNEKARQQRLNEECAKRRRKNHAGIPTNVVH